MSDTQGGLVRTRCDACGSQLAYAPGTQHLRCVACGGTVDIVHAPGMRSTSTPSTRGPRPRGRARRAPRRPHPRVRRLRRDDAGHGPVRRVPLLRRPPRRGGRGGRARAAGSGRAVRRRACAGARGVPAMGPLALVRAGRAEEGGGHRVAARLVRAALDVRRAHVVRVHGPARRRVLRHREAGGPGAPGAARELDARRGARRARLRRRARARVVPGRRARPRPARTVAARAGRAVPRRVPRRVRGGALRGRAARRARKRAQQKMAPSSGGTSSATSAATSSAWGRSAPPTPT